MSGDPVTVAYRRAMARYGELVTFRKEGFHGSGPPHIVRARVTGFKPEELSAGIELGTRRVIILGDAMPADVVPERGDRITIREGTAQETALTVESVDDSTRRVGGALVAYEIVATGA